MPPSSPRWKAGASGAMRSFFADTLALVVFFTITGALNERFIAGMSWSEVAAARAIGAPLMVLTARSYGLGRDWVMGWERPSSPLLRNRFALLAFQLPIYAAIIFAGGARGPKVAQGVGGAAVIMPVAGRPYGLWLDFVRRWFGLPPGGMKPMSPGG